MTTSAPSYLEQLSFDGWDWSTIQREMEDDERFLSRSFRLALPGPSPRVASVFAGCGGMDLGLSWAGYDLVFANELDLRATETYEANLGLPVRKGPIEDIDPASIPDHDLLVGGFPCQPFSYAGKRQGLRDDRGQLFFSLIDILDAKRPSHFLFENVKGLLTHRGRETFRSVTWALHDAGYDLSHAVLNASHFGVPQRRERVFLVGSRRDIGKGFRFPEFRLPARPVRPAIEDLIEAVSAPNNEPMRHTERIRARYQYIPQGGSMADVPPEHQQRKRGEPDAVSGKRSTQSYHRLREDQPCPTICAMFQAHFIHYSQDRNLTAREAARLQSFPDDFVFAGKRTVMSWDKELSQYAQIGNAVPPRMGYLLGRGIYEQLLR